VATPAIVRQINERKTLRALFEQGGMTRAEIARHLSLTKSTVGNVVGPLIRSGLVKECETRSVEARGRPGTNLGLNPAGAYFLGAEIGVDRLMVVLLDLAAVVRGRTAIEMDCRGATVDTVLDQLQAMVATVCRKASLAETAIKGLCVTVPGFITREGTILGLPLLGWRKVALGDALSRRFSWPVAVENDANASAFAEWYLTPSLRDRELLLILLESGVGAGHISAGRIVRGAHGTAGEVGHMQFGERVLDGFRSDGLPWESVIGKAALLAAAKPGGGYASIGGLRAGLAAREAAACDLCRAWARWLARGLAALACVHDPDDIILGGELARLFVDVRDVVEETLCHSLVADFPLPRLCVASFPTDGCAMGAAAIMHSRLFSDVQVDSIWLADGV
jgi:predicted NBD/HSP70 family sugar kinase